MLVAFSGGADSTALLHALTVLAADFHLALEAAHLDHAIDDGSRERSERAADLARRLGVEITIRRRSAIAERRSGESLEAAARRIRYDFLCACADRAGASWIVTAHQADDQRETVLLRLLFGSGLAGLRGIPARRGRILRPFLDVDRPEIDRYLSELKLEPIEDPTNLHLSIPRNLVRHRILPALRSLDPDLDGSLVSIARTAERAVPKLDRRILGLLDPQSRDEGLLFDRKSFLELPDELRRFALGSLCRAAGAPPPTRASIAEIERQFIRGAGLGCDLGSGWRLEGLGRTLRISPTRNSPERFAYTLRVPGEIRIPELSRVFRLTRRPVEAWMFRGSRWRAGMELPLSAGQHVTIRNRRSGDRLQPLGCEYRKSLKDVLIDRKIPREERDSLPLLCFEDNIVWVPGVTIDETVRLHDATHAWVAEIENDQEPEQ
jgi:tRNA(Ile)-lysidine synthase